MKEARIMTLMSGRSLAYWASLLIGLMIVGVLLNKGIIQGVVSSGDVNLSTNNSTYLLGESIIFTGQLDFAQNEENQIDGVRLLNTTGAQELDVSLPIFDTGGTFVALTGAGIKGTLQVKITFNNVGQVVGGAASTLGSTTGSTLGSTTGSTLGAATIDTLTGTYKGLAPGANITYVVKWTPPILLDPQPIFSLISYPGGGGTRQREHVFNLPTLTPPTQAVGTKLPASDAEITIPTVGQPTGTVLPDTTGATDIPTITVVTNATATDAKISGYNSQLNTWAKIPDTSALAATAPAGTGSIDQSSNQFFYAKKALPTIASSAAPSGVPSLDASGDSNTERTGLLDATSTLSTLFDNNNIKPTGIANNGDYWWVIDDNGGRWDWPPGIDTIKMISATTSAVVWTMEAPSELDMEGLAYYNNILYIAGNGNNWNDTDSMRNSRIFALDVTHHMSWSGSVGSSVNWWASTAGTANASGPQDIGLRIGIADMWDEIGSLTVGGTKLYAGAKWGKRWFSDSISDLTGSNASLSTKTNAGGGGGGNMMFFDPFMGGGGDGGPNCDIHFEGMAFKGDLIYTIGITDWWPPETFLCTWDLKGDLQSKLLLETSGGSNLSSKEYYSMTWGSATHLTDILYAGQSCDSWSSCDTDLYNAWQGETIDTTSPKGIAYSAADAAIFVLVDGSPSDQILKVSWNASSQTATTTTLATSTGAFGSDGYNSVPTSNAEGIAYLADSSGTPFLWVIANDSTKRIYKITAATGAVDDTIDLDFIWDDIGGITTDGTDLFVFTKSAPAIIFKLDPDNPTSGVQEEWPCCWDFEGGRAFSYHSGTQTFYGFKQSRLVNFDSQRRLIEGSVQDISASSTHAVNQTTMTSLSDGIEGADFYGNQSFIVSGAYFYLGYLAENVTTKPTAVAHTPATSSFGDSLYVIVDASPKDKLLKLSMAGSTATTSNATLDTGFSSDGVIDAPSGNIEAMVYVEGASANESYLYMIGNEGAGHDAKPTLYKVNPSTGAEVGSGINLQNRGVWAAIGAMAYDGTNILVYGQRDNLVMKIDTDGNTNPDFGEKWPCCPNTWGANAMSYQAGRDAFYTGQSLNMVKYEPTFDFDQQAVGSQVGISFDVGTYTAIRGMAWDQDLLYFGYYNSSDVGWIGRGALEVTVSTQPAAIAYSPGSDMDGISNQYRGTQIGEALWVLTEGSPTQKIVKMSTTTELCADGSSCLSNFPSTATAPLGYVDAPTAEGKGVGLTYLNDSSGDPHLWLVANTNDGQKLYKIKPTDGSVVTEMRLGDCCQIHDNVGGLSHNGTNLLIFGKTENFIAEITTNFSQESKQWLESSMSGNGSAAIAYRQDKQQVITAKDNKFSQWVSFGGNYFKATDYTATTPIDSSDDVLGMTFKPDDDDDYTNDVLYVAYVEGSAGKIARTGIPSDKTNKPKGLAFAETDYTCPSSGSCTASNDFMYVLVEGIKSGDHVLKLDFSSGATSTITADFALMTEDAESLTYVPAEGEAAGDLYIAYVQHSQGGSRRIIDRFQTDHTNTGSWGIATRAADMDWEEPCCDEIMGMSYDGQNFVVTPQYGGPHLDIIDTGGNTQGDTVWFEFPGGGEVPQGMDGLAYRAGDDPEYFAVNGKDVWRFNEGGITSNKYTLTEGSVSSIKGAVFGTIGGAEKLYLATLNSNVGTIRSAVIPEVIPTLTSNPRGMTYGDGSFYVILDTTSSGGEAVRDKIVKMDVANNGSVAIDTSWGVQGAANAPGSETEGITYVPEGFGTPAGLYVVSNEEKSTEICPEGGGECYSNFAAYPAIYRMTATSTAKFDKGWSLAFEWQRSDPSTSNESNHELLQCAIGALAFSPESDLFYMAMSDGQTQGNGDNCRNDWEGREAAAFVFDANDTRYGVRTPWGDFANIRTTNATNIRRLYANNGLDINGQESMVAMPSIITMGNATSSGFDIDRRLAVSGYTSGTKPNRIIRLSTNRQGTPGYISDPETAAPEGVSYDAYLVSGTSTAEIRGMAFLGQDIYLADDADNKVYKTFMPEQTVETTVVGNYTTRLTATVRSNAYATSTTFAIQRNTNPQIAISSPQHNFVSTSSPATLTGYINDPAATRVTVGMALPYVVLADDGAEDGSTSTDKWTAAKSPSNSMAEWHTDDSVISPAGPESGSNVWRFGVSDENHFRGHPTQGTVATLTLGDPGDSSTPPTGVISVTGPISLRFISWFESRIDPGHDVKKLMIAIINQDLAGNDISPAESDWQEIARWVGPGFEFTPPANAHAEHVLYQTNPQEWREYYFSLTDFDPVVGATVPDFRVMLRFVFDSVDQFGFGKGWAIDNIKVAGSGVLTDIVSTTALATPVVIDGVTYYKSFTGSLPITEGKNSIGAFFTLPYMPALTKLSKIEGFLDQTPPVVGFSALPSSTNSDQIEIGGTVEDMTFSLLTVQRIDESGTTDTIYTTTGLSNVVDNTGSFTLPVTMPEGLNRFVAIAQDQGGITASTTVDIIADRTAPNGSVGVVSITSEGQALVGDKYFVTVTASDVNGALTTSGVSTVTDTSSSRAMENSANVPGILIEMHELGQTAINLSGSEHATTTHITMNTVAANTPSGANTVSVTLTDGAGNSRTVEGLLNVVSQRTNRNFFLFPEFNYMGLALIPDDGDPATADDADVARLMETDVTERVNPALVTDFGGTVRLKDIVESVSAFTKAGDFVKYNPGPAADALTELKPFQGMTIRTKIGANSATSTSLTPVEVFKQVNIQGFTAQQSVPIRYNIEGVLFQLGQVPPDKELRVGYNLVAPHILTRKLYNTVFRGALIPKELAISALTFERSVDASVDAVTGDITAAVTEGFTSSSLGDYLEPTLSYWTFVVDDPDDTRTNELGDPKGPTITP